MKDNPFIITGLVPRPYFCDREKESVSIIRTLTGGGNITLISARRIGKSKLINFCFEEDTIKKGYYTFYVDLLHTSSIQELVYAFGKEVFSVLGKRNANFGKKLVAALSSISAGFEYDPITGCPKFSIGLGDIVRPEYTLEEIFSILEKADKPCLVAFDEFQQITNYSDKNVEALLRSHIQRSGNANFVFSGSERHLISEMFLSSAKPFYNSTDIIELKPIAKDKYITFVNFYMKNDGRLIEEKDIDYVYNLFEGNTYCMQKVFHQLYSEFPAGTKYTSENIADVIDSIIEDASDGYARMLSHLTLRQKEFLYAIANEGGRAEKVLSGNFVRKHSLSSQSAVQAACGKLIEMGLLTKEENAITIEDHFLRIYLSR
mgnify:CR=1 FL=1